MPARYDVAVIGGGFYGCIIARYLRRHFPSIILLEKATDLLQRASYVNQARVHNGYHYPRSLLTALRSRVNFPRFVQEFADCIQSDFMKCYAIPKTFSKITASYFEQFCRRIGAPIAPAPAHIRRLFRDDLIEEVFQVEEFAFDAVKLKGQMWESLREAGVEVRLGTTVRRALPCPENRVVLECEVAESSIEVEADQVFNCTYSQINQLLIASGQAPIPLKHEIAEIALLQLPEPLQAVGITVMCGPFFSCMPFPARQLHSLSHVRYTPHGEWHDDGRPYSDAHTRLQGYSKQSNFPRMIRDAQRYLPLLGECRHVDSLWEVKTVLPVSEQDDSRPILFKKHVGMNNLHCIMGAKIDNTYDVLDEIEKLLSARRAA